MQTISVDTYNLHNQISMPIFAKFKILQIIRINKADLKLVVSVSGAEAVLEGVGFGVGLRLRLGLDFGVGEGICIGFNSIVFFSLVRISRGSSKDMGEPFFFSFSFSRTPFFAFAARLDKTDK